MEKEPLTLLSQSSIQNDISLPIWIYKIEQLVVKSRRYLKVYLLNRCGTGGEINRITFVHDGKDYEVTEFRPVTQYNDNNYKGAVIQLDLTDTSKDMSIRQEILNGKIYDAAGKLVHFELPSISAEHFQYLRIRKNIDFYPAVQKDYWLCTCGRIHGTEDTYCQCHRSLTDINSILSFDFDTAFVKEYLSSGMSFNFNRSFEDNLNSYAEAFTGKYHVRKEQLLAAMDLDAERSRYDTEAAAYMEQKRIAEEKEKALKIKEARKSRLVNRIIIAAAACLVLAAALVVGLRYKKEQDSVASADQLWSESKYTDALKIYKTYPKNKSSRKHITEYADTLWNSNKYNDAVSLYSIYPQESSSQQHMEEYSQKIMKALKDNYYSSGLEEIGSRFYIQSVSFTNMDLGEVRYSSDNYAANGHTLVDRQGYDHEYKYRIEWNDSVRMPCIVYENDKTPSFALDVSVTGSSVRISTIYGLKNKGTEIDQEEKYTIHK